MEIYEIPLMWRKQGRHDQNSNIRESLRVKKEKTANYSNGIIV